jgi:hypothetical protein
MNYFEWNEAIGKHFFNADRSGSRVFLYVTTEVLNEIGEPYNADIDDFIAAVRQGPPWEVRPGVGICQQALHTIDRWRDRNLGYPPYLCYLSLFVYADSIDVGFARHSYYPGLRSLIGEIPESGMYPSFNQMYKLWDDLAVWSNVDRHGELGIFDADIVGEWMHVGLPKAQTLLTDRERESLPKLFAENGLDPHSPPSDLELSYLLTEDPHHFLRAHTKQLLRSKVEADSAIRVALIDAIFEELGHWDGTVTAHSVTAEQERNSFANLRLVMILDLTGKSARFYLRCRSNLAYPEEGLQLLNENGGESLYCYEDWQGWSTPLDKLPTQGLTFDASTVDWRSGFSLVDSEHAWRTSLTNHAVRIMVRATSFGFEGFIEESQIPFGKKFYLLAHHDYSETLQSWGQNFCRGFVEIKTITGLPQHWHLFSVECAKSDISIRDILPSLAFPLMLRIQFRGGLKVRGNQYFNFALPFIEVSGETTAIEVFCNDRRLQQNTETGLYSVPGDLRGRRLIIEVRRGAECIRKKSLYILDKLVLNQIKPLAYLDKFGRHVDDKTNGSCCGPIVHNFPTPDFYPKNFLPPSNGNHVYFIGRNPGEIVETPHESIPKTWEPIWAIRMEKGFGTAIYCGTTPTKEEPTHIWCKDLRRKKLWKKIIWYKRKRISFSDHPLLSALWIKYRKVAKDVR